MEHERSQIADLFSVGHKAGAWGDLPATPADFDPQILVSRNEGVQPFFLTCERDSLVVTLSGEGFVEFRDSNVLHFRVAPGDFVYVPAGDSAPHPSRRPDGAASLQGAPRRQRGGLVALPRVQHRALAPRVRLLE